MKERFSRERLAAACRRLGQYLRLIGLYFKVNLSGAMAYRATFVMQAAGMAFSNAFFIVFWAIAFAHMGGGIGGYAFDDVMFIWATATSAYGLSYMLFGNQARLSGSIISGEMDVYLLQPKPPLLGMMCAGVNLSAWGDFAYGIILMLATQHGNPMAWLMYLAGVLAGVPIIAGVSMLAHSLTFYLGNANIIGGMAMEFMISMTVYPLGIYRGVIRALMFSLLPAAFIVHIPLSLVSEFKPLVFLGVLAGACAYCALAYWVFMRGVKRYESGNLIITRM